MEKRNSHAWSLVTRSSYLAPLSSGLVALFGLATLAAIATARDIPSRLAARGPVVDEAGLMSGRERQVLAALIHKVRRERGPQFGILTVTSLEGEPIETFSIRVAEAWKLGSEERDDGLLIVITKAERGVRIEVGGGLEGEITDVEAGRVIRHVLTPAFRKGAFGQGLISAVAVLTREVTGELPEGAPVETPRTRRGSGGLSFLPLLFLLLLFSGRFFFPLLLLGGLGRMGRGYRCGGLGGGGFLGGGGWSGGGGGFSGGGASGSW